MLLIKMKRGIILSVCLAVVLLSPFVLGGISFGETESLYNLGDIVNVSAYLSSGAGSVGFFGAYLVCGLNEIEIYKSVQVVGADQEKEILIQTSLDNEIIGNLSGSCYIKGTYGAGQSRSKVFNIVNKINVKFNIDGVSFEPGEIINLTGKAVKKNGQPLNGFVEIVFEGVDLINYGSPKLESLDLGDDAVNKNEVVNSENESVASSEGSSSGGSGDSEGDAVKLWKSLHPGEELPAEFARSIVSEDDVNDTEIKNDTNGQIEEVVEEKKENDDVIKLEIEEEGVEKEAFIIGSVISEVSEGVFSVNFVVPDNAPPGSYTALVRAYDRDRQGAVMNEGSASNIVKIRQVIRVAKLAFNLNSIVPGNEFLFTPLVYDQAENLGEGDMEIMVYKPDNSVFMNKILKSGETYSIFVETNYTPGYWKIEGKMGEVEAERTFFVEELEFISSYIEEGTLVIRNMGNVVYEKPIEVKIGDVTDIKQVKLGIGESRRFRLSAPEGDYNVEINDGSNVENLGVTFLTGRAISVDEIRGMLAENYWMLILLLVIVMFIIVVIVIIKKIRSGNIKIKVPRLIGGHSGLKATGKPFRIGAKADSSMLVDSGKREEVSLISLKIKNLEKIRSVAGVKTNPIDVLDGVLLNAKSTGAKIYVDGEYRVIIFSPSISKGETELLSIKIAKDIENVLSEFNKGSEDKILHGIGVHYGEMAVEKKEGKIKFVSLGNTVAIAKRLSEMSNSDVLLSDQMHKKTLGKIKVEKKGEFWKVKRMMNREQYDDFINKFLNRQTRRR